MVYISIFPFFTRWWLCFYGKMIFRYHLNINFWYLGVSLAYSFFRSKIYLSRGGKRTSLRRLKKYCLLAQCCKCLPSPLIIPFPPTCFHSHLSCSLHKESGSPVQGNCSFSGKLQVLRWYKFVVRAHTLVPFLSCKHVMLICCFKAFCSVCLS